VSRAWALALLAVSVGVTPAAAQRSLAIKRFDAAIRVEPDGGIQVTETIVAQFTGSWNGIYRTIPVKYRTAQGLNWTLGLDIAGRERHYLKLRIWVPGAENATRTVVLQYRATNALRFFDEHDELYWNVTGDEWDVPIEAATAQIELPPGTEGVRAIAFNGVYGSRAQDASVETSGTAVRIAMPHALGFHEGLTAVVGWSKGVVAEPTAVARTVGVFASNWPLGIPVVVFIGMFLLWQRSGKDPRPRPVAVQYKPPKDMTPAEAGTLLDNDVDMRDITATLVDLGVRGYLRFEERDDPKFFGLFSEREYVIHRLQPTDAANGLAEHERLVLAGIFSRRGTSVELSQLEDEFYTELPGIRSSIFNRLKRHGFYRARPDRVRKNWRHRARLQPHHARPHAIWRAGAGTRARLRGVPAARGFRAPQTRDRGSSRNVRPVPAVRDGVRSGEEMGEGVRGDLHRATSMVHRHEWFGLQPEPAVEQPDREEEEGAVGVEGFEGRRQKVEC
jgi:hypothetical protein